MYYQVNHAFLEKKMLDFLPLVKLKCHDNFHRVLPTVKLYMVLENMYRSDCMYNGLRLYEAFQSNVDLSHFNG